MGVFGMFSSPVSLQLLYEVPLSVSLLGFGIYFDLC